jgi:phosphoribosylanthranilate isomerase
MVDAKVAGALGGTGHAFDWDLVVGLAKRRRLVLAGGLGPHNVAEAVRRVAPWCVDVASGVESAPGVKDLAKVRAFVAAARSV